MRGWQLHGYGDYDQLTFSEHIDVPEPGPHQALVRVRAAGVNNTDINTRIGWYAQDPNKKDKESWSGSSLSFPRIQGADVCGIVEEVGPGADGNLMGSRVIINPVIHRWNGHNLDSPWYLGSETDGGFAEYCVVPKENVFPIQSTLSDAELASFPCSYSTAENLCHRTAISSSDRVLITGASGGVGSAAIQLAKARGAEVLAISSPKKFELIQSIGADGTLSRERDIIGQIEPNSVDVVIDLVGGRQWPQLLQALKPKGRYGCSGAIAGASVELDLRTLYLKDLSFFGATVIDPVVFPNLTELIQNQVISPLIAETFPLEGLIEAQESFKQKTHVGKIVLTL